MNFIKIKPPYNCEPLHTKGLTNELFLINKQYFLKQSKPIKQPFLNFTNQLNVIKVIQWQKFTLPIIESKIKDNKLFILMPYYHNLITLHEQPLYEEILLQIALLVKKLHQIKFNANDNITTWNGLQQLALYSNLITTPVNLDKIKLELSTWLNNYQPQNLVLCHNDLTLNNFVKENGQWYVIDWDFACWNDELFDIASFASESLTNSADIAFWFKCFDLTEEKIFITKKWMTYQNLIWYYWACYLYDQTKLEIYQEISANKLMKLLKKE